MEYNHHLEGNSSNRSSIHFTSSGNNGGRSGGDVSLEMLMNHHSKDIDLQELNNGMKTMSKSPVATELPDFNESYEESLPSDSFIGRSSNIITSVTTTTTTSGDVDDDVPLPPSSTSFSPTTKNHDLYYTKQSYQNHHPFDSYLSNNIVRTNTTAIPLPKFTEGTRLFQNNRYVHSFSGNFGTTVNAEESNVASTSMNSSNGSAATVHALKRLQERINKLEKANQDYENKCKKLSSQLKNVKSQYEKQNSLSSGHLSKLEIDQQKVYSELHNQKNDLHLQLIKKDEHAKSLNREIEMLREEKTSWDSDREISGRRELHLRNRISVLEEELQHSQARERELKRNMGNVDAATRALQEAADQARKEMNSKLKNETNSRHESEFKALKTKTFLKTVIDINKTLVDKKTKNLKSNFVSSSGSTNVKKSAQKKSDDKTVRYPSSTGLLKSKKKQSNSRLVRATASSKAKQASRKGAALRCNRSKKKDIHTQLKGVYGKEIPFLLGTNSGQSSHVLSWVQKDIAVPEGYGAKGINRKPSVRNIQDEIDEEGYYEERIDEELSTPQKVRRYDTDPGLRSVLPMNSEARNEMNNAIQSLEEEYDELNFRYKTLLDEAANGGAYIMDERKLNGALQHLIGQIEKKGELLSSIKRYYANAQSLKERVPVCSPDASMKRIQALRSLQGYRSIQSPSKI